MTEAGGAPAGVTVRRATTADVQTIRGLVDAHAADRRLLSKATVTLYEDVQEFFVAELAGEVVGCGALHVLWEDLAEVRTVEIVGLDLQADGGTHVANTAEVGTIRIVDYKSKGKINKRLEVVILDKEET